MSQEAIERTTREAGDLRRIQVEVVLEYEYSRNLGFLVSYSQFLPGRYIKDTGPSETVHFVGTEIESRF